MVSKQVNTLGFELNVNVPDNVAEYDNLAKKQGACLESAVLNVLYRSVFAKFRQQFAEAVENNTGIARLTEPTGKKVKNDDGTESDEDQVRYTETEKVYFDRACAELVKSGQFASVEAAAASFASLAQQTITSIAFDPSESEKTPSGPKKVAKAYTVLAEKAAAAGKLEALASQLASKLGNWKVEATVDSVAKAIAEDQRRKREAQKLDAEYGV
jgi:hypothetical protein